MDLISSGMLKASLKHLRIASSLDYQKRYQEAVLAYVEGASLLMRLSKEEGTNAPTKQFLKSKSQLYLDRIQVIRTKLEAGEEDIPQNVLIDKIHPNMDGTERYDKQLIQSLLHVPFQCSIEEVPIASPLKEFMCKNIVLPMMFPGLLGSVTRVKRGVLLYGHSGSGKTMLLCAIASAVWCPFFHISVPELIWRCHGMEHMLRRVREMFVFAHQNQPCILCLDDLDLLCMPDLDIEGSLTRIAKQEIIVQLRDLSLVTVIATIQKPWNLDGNLLRRFDRRFYLALPTYEERMQIITRQLASVEHQLSGDDLECFGHLTSGCTVSDLLVLIRSCSEAGAHALHTATHFRKVIVTSTHNRDEKTCEMMMPCEMHDPGAIEITAEFLNPERIEIPPLTMTKVQKEVSRKVIQKCSADDLQKMTQWHEEFGQED